MRVEQNETATFSFHGPAVNDGRMEIRDFVEAARGFSVLLEVASKHNGTPVDALKISNIKQGSFLATLSIEFDTSLLNAVRDFFTSDNATAVSNMAAVMTVIGTAINAFRKLRSGKPDKVEAQGDRTVVYDAQNVQIYNGPTVIYNVAVDPRFADGLDAFATPLKNPGVEKAKLFPGSPKSTVELDRSIFDYLNDDPDYRVETRTLDLHVRRIAFDGASWRFRVTPENAPEYEFTANILDKRFLDRAHVHDTWGPNDFITASLREWIPQQQGKHRKYEILEVFDIVHQPTLEIFEYDPRGENN